MSQNTTPLLIIKQCVQMFCKISLLKSLFFPRKLLTEIIYMPAARV